MANKPRVSVITPTFNRADYLSEAIDSVLTQTFGDFEFIVIDDGSTDHTPELIKGYLDDPRVRYFQQPNQGQSVARNRGVAESVGDFICFLDSDNAWVETKLAASLQAFEENHQADVVYGDYVVIDAEGRESGVNRMTRYSGRITPMLICDNFVSMNTTMTRRRCFDEMGAFDSNDRLAEDYGLWLRFSTRYQFLYLPEVLGYYRVMEDQISSDKDSRFQSNEELILEFLKAYPDALDSLEARQGLSRFYHRKGRYELSVGRSKRAAHDLGRSLLQYPVWSGPWRLAAKLAIHVLRGGAS